MADKKKILLVDDDEMFRLALQHYLQEAGYEVVTAQGQQEADGILENYKPDLAIVDLFMEEHDSGFVLSYHIKKIDPAIPVIMVTALGSEMHVQFDTATNEERSWIKADILMDKPVRFEQVRREIDRFLQPKE